MSDIFFSSWESLLRTGGIGVLTYLALIFMLRLTGNRTLSQMNSFDFIVTIALGSTFSSGMLDKSIPLADTLLAFVVLIGLQWMITKLSVRYKAVNNLVKSDPVLLFYHGSFFKKKMHTTRVTREEILASIRQDGLSSLDQVEAVVLETNGKLSAVPKQLSHKIKYAIEGQSSLEGVEGFDFLSSSFHKEKDSRNKDTH
jgi:uncharacterized membrane protein YcaP (DUF421 family)